MKLKNFVEGNNNSIKRRVKTEQIKAEARKKAFAALAANKAGVLRPGELSGKHRRGHKAPEPLGPYRLFSRKHRNQLTAAGLSTDPDRLPKLIAKQHAALPAIVERQTRSAHTRSARNAAGTMLTNAEIRRMSAMSSRNLGRILRNL